MIGWWRTIKSILEALENEVSRYSLLIQSGVFGFDNRNRIYCGVGYHKYVLMFAVDSENLYLLK